MCTRRTRILYCIIYTRVYYYNNADAETERKRVRERERDGDGGRVVNGVRETDKHAIRVALNYF